MIHHWKYHYENEFVSFNWSSFWKLKGLKFLKYETCNFESEDFIIYIICHIMKVLMTYKRNYEESNASYKGSMHNESVINP